MYQEFYEYLYIIIFPYYNNSLWSMLIILTHLTVRKLRVSEVKYPIRYHTGN